MKILDYFLIPVAATLVAATVFFAPKEPKESRVLLAPPPHLSLVSFGQQMTIADNLWIRAIQDFDYCDQEVAARICRGSSWLYQMLNEITNLAPDYLTAYREGGMALSVLISDAEGATKLMDKGLAVIQDDWNFYYRAAYHSLFEEKNKKKAAERFLAAARLQGLKGEWFYNIASRLYDEAGERQAALQIYKDMKEQGLDEAFLKRMREKLNLTEE